MPADWDQVIDLYASAKQLPPEEWDEFLRCQTADLQLLKEVASLLQVDLPANDPLERPVMDWFPVESRSTESNAILPRLLIGETLAKRFLISHFLGRGGMGEVYGAKDLELGETVAIKVLHPDLAAQPSFLERFRREIRLTRRISHPNVARVFDMVQDPSHPLGPLSFYVMEKLDGETLAARIKRDGRVPMNEALNIARQLAAGLGAAIRNPHLS